MSAMASSALCTKVIAIAMVVFLSETVLATRCIERDDQIQRYFISLAPPYDNYYNISKAIYPSVDLPSMLIDITITFLATTTDSDASTNGSTSNQNRPDSHLNITRKYKWSKSCLYVSGGDISLTSMNLFSLGAIWPNRRERKLHITLPQFCSGSPDEVRREETMIYFLSTLQDIAVVPSLHDPQMNTAECVIKGHKKASNFSGLKQLLHGVCWSLLVISLVMSVFLSQWILVQLSKWDKEKEKHQSNIVAVMVLSLFIFVGGLALNIIALALSAVHDQQLLYLCFFFGAVFVVLLRRAGWCILVHHRNSKRRNSQLSQCFKMGFTAGHGEETSKNFVSMFILYPATFMACHHFLWILLGIITEPFWGFTVFVAIISVCAVFYFLVSELYKAIYLKPEESRNDKFVLFVSVVLVIAGISAFVLLVMVLFVVAQSFLSESLISTIVQTVLLFVLTVWFKYMGLHVGAGEGGEGRGREIADERETRESGRSGEQFALGIHESKQ